MLVHLQRLSYPQSGLNIIYGDSHPLGHRRPGHGPAERCPDGAVHAHPQKLEALLQGAELLQGRVKSSQVRERLRAGREVPVSWLHSRTRTLPPAARCEAPPGR